KLHKLILILFILFYSILNVHVLILDKTPFIHDIGDSYLESINYYNAIKNRSFNDFKDTYLRLITTYPPLNRLVVLPFYFLFGVSEDVASISNLFYFIIIVFSVYYIGKKIYSSECGFYSSIILSLFTGVFSFSRVFLPDYPLLGIVSLSIALMIGSNHFRNRITTIFFGISLGLGMLSKWTFFVYIIGPSIIYFFKSIKLNKHKNNKYLFNLIFSLISGAIVSLSWYFNKFIYLYQKAYITNSEYMLQFPGYKTFSIQNLALLSNFMYLQILPGFFILIYLLFPLIIFIKNKWKYLLLSWVLIPYAILSLNSWKFGRYLLPIMPAIAIIFVLIIMKLFEKSSFFHYKKILLVIILFLILNFVFVSLNQREKNELISEGILGPDIDDGGLMDLHKFLENESLFHKVDVIAIPNLEFISEFKHKSYFSNYDVKTPFFCIGHKGKYQCGDEDYPKNYLSGDIVCSSDYVLTLKENFNWDTYNLMHISNREEIEKKVVIPINSKWKKCKDEFEIVYEISNLLTKDGKLVNLFLYKRMKISN
ncbi:hypothetical protein HOD20_03970, partial [archaeon]|nr:hypothetical protein [archaeon]